MYIYPHIASGIYLTGLMLKYIRKQSTTVINKEVARLYSEAKYKVTWKSLSPNQLNMLSRFSKYSGKT